MLYRCETVLEVGGDHRREYATYDFHRRVLLERLDHLLQPIRGYGVAAVRQYDDSATAGGDPGIAATAAVDGRVVHHTQRHTATHLALAVSRRIVLGATVGDNDLIRQTGAGKHRIQRGCDARTFVWDWNDERNGRA